MSDDLKCPHFPHLETLGLARPFFENYARLTHPSHPDHQTYRNDLLGIPRPGAPPIPSDAPIHVATTRFVQVDPEREREQLRFLEIVQGCDYRSGPIPEVSGEGCCAQRWNCGLGRGSESNPFHVSYQQCLACVSRTPEVVSSDVPVAPTPSTPEHEMSLIRKAWNFGKAVVSHVAAGMPTLDDAAYEARLAICYDCDRYRDGTCEVCKCNLKIKARWSGEQCPIGKWPEISQVVRP